MQAGAKKCIFNSYLQRLIIIIYSFNYKSPVHNGGHFYTNFKKMLYCFWLL